MNNSDLGFVDIAILIFAPMAIAASFLRVKGAVGWLVIAVMVAVVGFVFVSLSGSNMLTGLLAAMAGLLVGGKVSDWRESQRVQKATEGERRNRDARFR